jgi:imidazolonepropionase-like amidohydrolase
VPSFRAVRIFDGSRFLDGVHDLTANSGKIDAIGSTSPDPWDREGGVLFPGFVDAHVHLSFSRPELVAKGGVTTVLDLGAPAPYALAEHPPLRFRFAGTLLTAPGGYPTRSWGADGYGTELSSTQEARDAVAKWADAGVAMIKVALEPREGPMIDDELLRVVVKEARARDLLVAAHALERAAVRRAIDARVDVLAHTPTDRLGDNLVTACATRRMWVVSTIRAFGASRRTKRNLAQLHDAGCRIVYGTDLGNGAIHPGLDVDELEIIEGVTGDVESTLACACSRAGELAGNGGRIAPGLDADLVWAPSFERLSDLRGPKDVWIGGTLVT